jgi:hypothetical protein
MNILYDQIEPGSIQLAGNIKLEFAALQILLVHI